MSNTVVVGGVRASTVCSNGTRSRVHVFENGHVQPRVLELRVPASERLLRDVALLFCGGRCGALLNDRADAGFAQRIVAAGLLTNPVSRGFVHLAARGEKRGTSSNDSDSDSDEGESVSRSKRSRREEEELRALLQLQQARRLFAQKVEVAHEEAVEAFDDLAGSRDRPRLKEAAWDAFGEYLALVFKEWKKPAFESLHRATEGICFVAAEGMAGSRFCYRPADDGSVLVMDDGSRVAVAEIARLLSAERFDGVAKITFNVQLYDYEVDADHELPLEINLADIPGTWANDKAREASAGRRRKLEYLSNATVGAWNSDETVRRFVDELISDERVAFELTASGTDGYDQLVVTFHRERGSALFFAHGLPVEKSFMIDYLFGRRARGAYEVAPLTVLQTVEREVVMRFLFEDGDTESFRVLLGAGAAGVLQVSSTIGSEPPPPPPKPVARNEPPPASPSSSSRSGFFEAEPPRSQPESSERRLASNYMLFFLKRTRLLFENFGVMSEALLVTFPFFYKFVAALEKKETDMSRVQPVDTATFVFRVYLEKEDQRTAPDRDQKMFEQIGLQKPTRSGIVDTVKNLERQQRAWVLEVVIFANTEDQTSFQVSSRQIVGSASFENVYRAATSDESVWVCPGLAGERELAFLSPQYPCGVPGGDDGHSFVVDGVRYNSVRGFIAAAPFRGYESDGKPVLAEMIAASKTSARGGISVMKEERDVFNRVLEAKRAAQAVGFEPVDVTFEQLADCYGEMIKQTGKVDVFLKIVARLVSRGDLYLVPVLLAGYDDSLGDHYYYLEEPLSGRAGTFGLTLSAVIERHFVSALSAIQKAPTIRPPPARPEPPPSTSTTPSLTTPSTKTPPSPKKPARGELIEAPAPEIVAEQRLTGPLFPARKVEIRVIGGEKPDLRRLQEDYFFEEDRRSGGMRLDEDKVASPAFEVFVSRTEPAILSGMLGTVSERTYQLLKKKFDLPPFEAVQDVPEAADRPDRYSLIYGGKLFGNPWQALVQTFLNRYYADDNETVTHTDSLRVLTTKLAAKKPLLSTGPEMQAWHGDAVKVLREAFFVYFSMNPGLYSNISYITANDHVSSRDFVFTSPEERVDVARELKRARARRSPSPVLGESESESSGDFEPGSESTEEIESSGETTEEVSQVSAPAVAFGVDIKKPAEQKVPARVPTAQTACEFVFDFVAAKGEHAPFFRHQAIAPLFWTKKPTLDTLANGFASTIRRFPVGKNVMKPIGKTRLAWLAKTPVFREILQAAGSDDTQFLLHLLSDNEDVAAQARLAARVRRRILAVDFIQRELWRPLSKKQNLTEETTSIVATWRHHREGNRRVLVYRVEACNAEKIAGLAYALQLVEFVFFHTKFEAAGGGAGNGGEEGSSEEESGEGEESAGGGEEVETVKLRIVLTRDSMLRFGHSALAALGYSNVDDTVDVDGELVAPGEGDYFKMEQDVEAETAGMLGKNDASIAIASVLDRDIVLPEAARTEGNFNKRRIDPQFLARLQKNENDLRYNQGPVDAAVKAIRALAEEQSYVALRRAPYGAYLERVPQPMMPGDRQYQLNLNYRFGFEVDSFAYLEVRLVAAGGKSQAVYRTPETTFNVFLGNALVFWPASTENNVVAENFMIAGKYRRFEEALESGQLSLPTDGSEDAHQAAQRLSFFTTEPESGEKAELGDAEVEARLAELVNDSLEKFFEDHLFVSQSVQDRAATASELTYSELLTPDEDVDTDLLNAAPLVFYSPLSGRFFDFGGLTYKQLTLIWARFQRTNLQHDAGVFDAQPGDDFEVRQLKRRLQELFYIRSSLEKPIIRPSPRVWTEITSVCSLDTYDSDASFEFNLMVSAKGLPPVVAYSYEQYTVSDLRELFLTAGKRTGPFAEDENINRDRRFITLPGQRMSDVSSPDLDQLVLSVTAPETEEPLVGIDTAHRRRSPLSINAFYCRMSKPPVVSRDTGAPRGGGGEVEILQPKRKPASARV